MSEKISRRKFLKIAGLTLGATTLTCSGVGFAATRTPEIETPASSYGKESAMNDRILVTYATRAGSTAEIADAIGESLGERGYAVDVKPVKETPDLAGYQIVLMGSAVRMGRWLPEAIEFIEANQATLNQMPVGLFTVHMQNTGDDEESRAARESYLDAVRPLMGDVEAVYFESRMDFSRLSFLDRLIAKAVGATETDNRDWDKIRAWEPEALTHG